MVLPIPFFPIKAVFVPRSNSISETFNKVVSSLFSINPTIASCVLKITLPVRLVCRLGKFIFCVLFGAFNICNLFNLVSLPCACLDF